MHYYVTLVKNLRIHGVQKKSEPPLTSAPWCEKFSKSNWVISVLRFTSIDAYLDWQFSPDL